MPICKNNNKKNYTGEEPSPKGLGYCASSEKEGTKMKGKDGNIWIKKNGRWTKFNNNNNNNKTKLSNKPDNKKITLEKLKELIKKYKVTSSGTKAVLA